VYIETGTSATPSTLTFTIGAAVATRTWKANYFPTFYAFFNEDRHDLAFMDLRK
jgi:hypothetical protein